MASCRKNETPMAEMSGMSRGAWRRAAGWPGPPCRASSGLFLGGGCGDRELLDDLVVAPLLGVVADDLEHEVQRLLAIALAVELDLAGHAVVLDLADRRRDVLATRGLAALGRRLDRLEGD